MIHTQTKVTIILDTLAFSQKSHDESVVAAMHELKNRLYDDALVQGVNVSSIEHEEPVTVAKSGIGPQL